MAILQGFTVDPAEALAPLLTIPEDITQNFVSAVEATAGALRVPVGLAASGAINATIAEVELTAQNFVNELRSGDLAGALVQVIDAPAQVLNATLNSEIPGYEGLLAPFQSVTQTGLADALVNYLPRTVAQAIGAVRAD